jgi:hypothetical protein
LSEVLGVNIVSHARSVRRRVITPIDEELFSPADSDLKDERNEVAFVTTVLTVLAVRVSS